MCECECISIARGYDLKKLEISCEPLTISPFCILFIHKKRHLLTCRCRQGHQSTGAGRGGSNATDFCQRMASFHQDVAIRGELRAGRRDDAGGCGACHRPGAYGSRYNARGTSEEDYEQRDGVTGADVGHLARFPRVIGRDVLGLLKSCEGIVSYVGIGRSLWNFIYPMDLTNFHSSPR